MYALLLSLLIFNIDAQTNGGTGGGGAPTLQGVRPGTFSRFTGPFIGDVIDVNNTFWGGLSGTCTGSNSSVCNSCESASPGEACNTQRIHNSLRLELTFIARKQGVVLVTNNFDENNGQESLNFEANVGGPGSGILVEPGTEVTVRIPWGEICRVIYESPGGCETLETFGRKPIRVGVAGDQAFLQSGEFISNLFVNIQKLEDGSVPLCNKASTTATGLCNFIAYPGDGKIFFESLRAECSLPNLGTNNTARFARVYYQEVDPTGTVTFPDITTTTFADLRLNQSTGACSTTRTAELRETTVAGLSNASFYSFAVGVVDQANNVGMVTDMTGAIDSGSVVANTTFDGDTFNDSTGCFDEDDPSWTRNCHISRPDEVIGLIQDEFDCFITTAAYGSPFREKVKTFRQFRNLYLKNHWLGQQVIDFYYWVSPPIAQWIKSQPVAQQWTRAWLWPLWLLAHLLVHYPIALVTFLILFSVLVLSPERRKQT
jgi:hypothetical protein